MDLTPDALRETTFRGALRGYNVDDVDEFVERVAVGVGELLEQVRLASERAAAAERRAKEVVTSEEAMKRTLGHAQQLAEALVTEARQDAGRIAEEARQAAAQLRIGAREEVAAGELAIEQARADAGRLQREAETERVAARAEAEALRAAARAEADELRNAARAQADELRASARADADAERVKAQRQLDELVADARQRVDVELQAEVERLRGVRQALQLDVAVLTSWMHDQRASVRGVLVDTLAAIDRSGPADDPPPITDVDTSFRLGDRLAPAAPSPPTPATAPAAGGVDPRSDVDDSAGQAAEPPLTTTATDDLPAAGIDERPPTTTFPDLSDEEFLAELKKAATDADAPPLGPREQDRSS